RAFKDDLGILRAMVREVSDSLRQDSNTLQLEASILGAALRNAAMIIAFVVGTPSFAANAIYTLRSQSLVEKIFDRLGESLVANLLAARLASERGFVLPHEWIHTDLSIVAREIDSWFRELAKLKLNEEYFYETPLFESSPTGAKACSRGKLSFAA